MGHRDVLMRGDRESSIVALAKAVKNARDSPTIIEPAVTNDPQSNGVAENAVKEVKGLVRTFINYIEEMAKTTLEANHAIITWIVRHAGFILSRHKIGSDGRTACERIKGRRSNRVLAAIGESVFYLPVKSARKAGMDNRFFPGVFVGVNSMSDEVLVATPTYLVSKRTE